MKDLGKQIVRIHEKLIPQLQSKAQENPVHILWDQLNSLLVNNEDRSWKTKSRHNANFVVTHGTACCHNMPLVATTTS